MLPLTVPNKIYRAIWLYKIALPNICNAVIILNVSRIENEMLYIQPKGKNECQVFSSLFFRRFL